MVSFEQFRSFIESTTDTISEITHKYYMKSSVEIELKGDSSPVTVADREIEDYLRRAISTQFPDHSIVGEELDDKLLDGEYKWIIDPIDGTYSFIHGVPLFTTLIALCQDEIPIYGAIYQPISGELVVGSKNMTLYNGKMATLRKREDLLGCTILATSTTNIERMGRGEQFRKLSLAGKCVRTWGDGYGYIMLVSGRCDVMLDPKMKIWDYAALIPIVQGAGGVITDFNGKDPLSGVDNIVATTSKVLHNKVLSVVNT